MALTRLPPRWLSATFLALMLSTQASQVTVAQEKPTKPELGDASFMERALRWIRSESALTVDDYQWFRAGVVQLDQQMRHEVAAHLSHEEKVANRYFDFVRLATIQPYQGQSALRQSQFPPARPFPLVRDQIQKSAGFKLIRKLPKGAELHVHSTFAGSARWVVEHMADFEGCHVYWPADPANAASKGKLGFFLEAKAPPDYFPIRTARQKFTNFDAEELKLLTIGPEEFAPTTDSDGWTAFGQISDRILGFVTHQPAFLAYFEAALLAMIDDGIDYVEMRSGYGQLSDLSGNVWKDADFIKQYLVVRDKIRQTHPDFDFRVIISDWRGAAPQGIEQDAARVVAARKAFPEFVIGYDLVGREASNERTLKFVDVFMKLRTVAAQEDVDLPVFFHDGETDWAGNDDVVDALLMGSRRIGHGFNAYAYPYVEQQLRKQKVALEVCPISNQILRYVNDLRIHPACGYVRRGVPCVLSSDDPFIFQNDGLSYDFWMAWTAWGLSLQDLKKLATNSLEYSALAPEQRTAALARWQKKWDSFTHMLAQTAGKDADFQRSLATPTNP